MNTATNTAPAVMDIPLGARLDLGDWRRDWRAVRQGVGRKRGIDGGYFRFAALF